MGTAPLFSRKSVRLLHSHTAWGGAQPWNAYLLALHDAPDETHTVQVTWGSRAGGGSPNNPYLQKARKSPTYTDTVRPGQLAAQLLRIREELAGEWQADLALVAADNNELRRHHQEEVLHVVDEQERFQHAIRPPDADTTGGASPLRQASFDLLKNACTAEALRLLIERLEGSADTRPSSAWLRGFRAQHAGDLVHGGISADGATARCLQWHAARSSLLRLMAEPVSMGVSPQGEARFLDPLAFAESAMELRAAIAREWIDACKGVPDEHLQLQRERLEQRMRNSLRGR